MASELFYPGRATDNDGDPLSGATWSFYSAGTLTPQTVYADGALTTPLGSVVTADSGGLFDAIYLNSALSYRGILATSAGVIVSQIDPIVIMAVLDSRSDAAALVSDLAPGTIISLNEGGRSGLFRTVVGAAPSDPLQGIYIQGTGKYLERIYDGLPRAEWWGAVLNNGAVDSAPALQASMDVTGKLYFPKGLYYGTAGLVDSVGCVIRGEGPLMSGYVCSSATDHLLDNSGTTSAFIQGGDYKGFALARGVTPTTPASEALARAQGHGLHLELTSNARVDEVYTYNNLVEVYVARNLAPQITNIRGLRQTGGTSDDWWGLYVYGDPTGMPGGWATGPSGNPSCTIKKIQMVASASVGNGTTHFSTNFRLYKNLQDLWIEDPEAGGGHTQFDIDADNTTAGDFFLVRPVADSFNISGFNVRDLPLNGTTKITDAWVAPAAGSSDSSVILSGAHGLIMSVTGDCVNSSANTGVEVENSSQMTLTADIVNCAAPLNVLSTNSSHFKVRGFKSSSGSNSGTICNVSTAQGCEFDLTTVATGSEKFLIGLNMDSGSTGCVINVTKTFTGSAIDKIKINGSAVTTQGNVSGHVIINPGAGAML